MMNKTEIRESNEWITMRWIDEQESVAANLPRLLHIGDSIANGASALLSKKLKGKYGVDLFATSKIVCDKDFMADMRFMLSKHTYDIMIFNNGLHGYPVDDKLYSEGLFDVMTELKTYTENLIWRNSTPCYPKQTGEANPWTEKIQIRNKLAAIEAEKLGISTINCYDALKDRPELVSDGVHFHTEGYEIMVDVICKYLEENL